MKTEIKRFGIALAIFYGYFSFVMTIITLLIGNGIVDWLTLPVIHVMMWVALSFLMSETFFIPVFFTGGVLVGYYFFKSREKK